MNRGVHLNAQGFLTSLAQATPFRITKIRTENGQEFTDRCGARGERVLTGKPRFDRIYHARHL